MVTSLNRSYYVKIKADEQVVITESLLVASVFGEENWSEGYFWVYSNPKGTHKILANQIEIDQEVKHLKRKEFDFAINLLDFFEKKEDGVRAIDSTNIYFMYFIERNLTLLKIMQILLWRPVDIIPMRYSIKSTASL